MKSVIDSYIGVWLVMLFLMLCIGFTSINLNVIQARKMYNDVKAQVQAANGSFVPASGVFTYDSTDSANGTNVRTIRKNGYEYKYKIEKQQLSSDETIQDDNETWIYNDLYKLTFEYMYNVPLFGTQLYPIVGYTY